LRVSVPDSILDRMSRAPNPEAARHEGVAIAREMLISVRGMVQGAQISAPQGRYSSAVDVLEALGSSDAEAASAEWARESFATQSVAFYLALDRKTFSLQFSPDSP